MPGPHPTSFADERYQVVRFLGEGGKKRVYLAHDSKLDRDVAFALLKSDNLDAEGLARIRREAQAMARLGDHPNIVAVYDIGDENGQPYLVCQYMAGGSLEDLLSQAESHRLPVVRALEIADQVCQALEHAHAQGIVHRDLKSGNVWLTGGPGDGGGGSGTTLPPQPSPARGEGVSLYSLAPDPQLPLVAKLGDFGLALSLDRSRLTQAGMMVGTVAYMAPEQALGSHVTARSDLYALGCMLYELVTGRPPFVGDESVAIITQHLNTPPVAPSWHAPDCPPGLEALILRLLEKDPQKRPASATEVRQILASVVAPTPTPPPSLGEGPGGAAGSPLPGLGERQGVRAENPVYLRTFVGRESELRQLQSAFDRALSGQGALLVVVGEPGIGKTALCEQLATYVAVRGGRTLVGHCYEEGSLSLPYLAFVEALRTYVLERDPDGLRQELGTGAADVARIVSEIRDRVAVEPRPPGDPEDDRWRLLQAVTGFVRNAAGVEPILLVLEDLHWADRGTLDLLVNLARNLSRARVLVVGTYRDVEVDRAHPLSAALAELRRVGDLPRVVLRGLTPDEVHRMINALQGQEVRWSFAEAVHRQTEGNPLFVQEVLRYLVEEGLIVRKDGRWEARWRDTGEAPPEMSIPEGLRDVIGRRLSRLSPECNRVLAIAAVIGREFDLEALRRVAEADEDALVAAVEEAERVGVVEERVRPGSIRYRFTHAFFRQTLYEELSAPRRLRIHQQVARALEQLYRSRLDEHAAELAEHFAHSTARPDLRKAVDYGERAARRAMAVYACGEAVRHLERAIEVQEVLNPDDRAKQCDLLLALGEALSPAGEPQRAYQVVAPRAFALARDADDRNRSFRASRMAVEAMQRYGGFQAERSPQFGEWASRMQEYATPGTVDQARADGAAGVYRMVSLQLQEGRGLFARSLELARQLDEPEALFHAGWYVIQHWSSPRLRRDPLRMSIADELARRPRVGVSTRTQGQFLWYAALAFLDWGDRDRFQELAAEVEELGKRTGDTNLLWRPLYRDLILATLDGRLEQAIEIADGIVALAEELGTALARSQSTLAKTRSLFYLGRTVETPLEQWSAYAHAFRAAILVRSGRHAEAQSQLGIAVDSPGVRSGEESATWLVWGLEAAVALGDRNAASLLAELLAPAARVLGTGAGDTATCFARHLGDAARMLGDVESARRYYQQALEICQPARFRPEIALARLGLAELALEPALTPTPSTGSGQALSQREREQERAEALGHLDFAIAELQAMKMQPSLERALALKSLAR